MADSDPLVEPTCAELRAAFTNMVLNGGEVLIKAGDQLVKYTDVEKLKRVVESLCGPIAPEGSTANRSVVFHVVKFNRGCGC